MNKSQDPDRIQISSSNSERRSVGVLSPVLRFRNWNFFGAWVLLFGVLVFASSSFAKDLPNIVYILADDLGHGDVKCLNPEGKIATPHLDRLAANGMIFTDAHSSSSVCTPTRYGVLTGRYNWRSRLKRGVLGGFSERLIEPDRTTVADYLRKNGYTTACIGKWHLGFSWQLKNGQRANDRGGFGKLYEDAWNVDYAKPILDGPLSVGFDYYFGISASLDMPPYVYIENDRATEIPTVTKKYLRAGPAGEQFEGIDVLPRITDKAVSFISVNSTASKNGKPFFLYMPLNSPHTPILPSPEWQGKSGLNAYADFVMQTDHSVGEVMAALDRNGLTENTLFVFTSDNGCSPQANFKELAELGHDPSQELRGHKADIFEGGHRIPFIVRWPAQVEAGSTTDQLTCLTDLFATAADIVGKRVQSDAAVDSVSMLPVLQGRADAPVREAVVHHSINGSFSIRQGKWKLQLCSDSGGWSAPRPGSKAAKELPEVQLYDLSIDIGEETNLEAEHPDLVLQMTALLQKYVDDGRSNGGRKQKNNGAVSIRR